MRADIKKALQRTFVHEGWAELLASKFIACRAKKFIRFFASELLALETKKALSSPVR